MKVPVIDQGACTNCEGCLEVCSAVFVKNDMLGIIEVADLDSYPQAEVDEAIKDCPADCISWE